MKRKRAYQISILISTALIVMGCNNSKPAPQEKPKVTANKPAPVVHKPTGITVSNLSSSGVSNLKIIASKDKYHVGEPIQFKINTNGKSGYLYIIYVDKNGQVSLLYPNAKAPLTELVGEYIFPRDFGNMTIRASKDCQDCQEDKTTIYALLSKDKIIDINNITQAQLVNFVGGNSSNSTSKVKTKAIQFDDGSNNRVDNSNIKVGKLTFSVVD